METLIRKTGKTCDVSSGIYHHPCGGQVIEHFTYHSRHTGPLIVGGRNAYENWIRAEFFCNKCGLVYRPTLDNKLVPFDKDKVLNVMENSYELELGRDVLWREILPSGDEEAEKEFQKAKNKPPHSYIAFLESTKLIGFYKNDRSGSTFEYDFSEKKREIFLIVNHNKPTPVLLDKTAEEHKRREARIAEVGFKALAMKKKGKGKQGLAYGKKHVSGFFFSDRSYGYHASAEVKIKPVIVPKNAVPAMVVNIMDNDLNIRRYWVPADAVKSIEKK